MGTESSLSDSKFPPRASTRLRAWSALALGALFFGSAVGLVVALMSLGFAVGHWSMENLRGRAALWGGLLAALCLFTGFVVALSLWPRRLKFKPPGPELKRALHPALFREIDRVAARCEVKAPRHVYLAPNVNAFVADVGGFAGLFTTRVLAVGLPLLHCLSRAEFRSVLAHEFGHYAQGDTHIGGWVFRTRGAVQRVVENLEHVEASTGEQAPLLWLFFSLMRWPFVMFGNFYLRFSLALSRAQEFSADALAAQLEGAEVLIRALQGLRHADIGFDGYMRDEVEPLLAQGVLPPIGPGLARFLEAPAVREQLEKVSRVLDGRPQQQLDSHPPLHARIARARGLRLGPHRGNSAPEGPAFELVNHLSELELLLAEPWVKGANLKRAPWEKVGPALERGWRARAKQLAPLLQGVTPASLPSGPEQLRPLLGGRAKHVPPEQVAMMGVSTFSPVFTVLLLDAGFTFQSSPGADVRVVRGDEHYEPERLLREYLFEGRDEAWRAMWEATGLTHADLSRLTQ